MIEIIPAIIPKSFADFTEKLSQVSRYVPVVQIDICDGKFTGEKSWPYSIEEEGFPFWEEVTFEIDLMVENPDLVVDEWVHAGAERIVVHFESFPDAPSTQTFINTFKEKFFSPGSAVSVGVGLAINMDTPLEEIEPLFPCIDFLQCMGIARIGYQGEPFDERVLGRVSDLRARYPDLVISVDGGVSEDSAPKLESAGANRLVVGSAIFRSGDISGTIDTLRNGKHYSTENN